MPLLVAGLLAGICIALGFVLLIVPGLVLLTIWAVIAPVIVIERTGALEAFGRSRVAPLSAITYSRLRESRADAAAAA